MRVRPPRKRRRPPPKTASAAMEKPSKKNALRESILARKAAIKPITFSLDEVRAIAKTNAVKAPAAPAKAARPRPALPAKAPAALEKPAKPNHIKAASLADILGFNPKKAKPAEPVEAREVPEKFRRYYRLLVDMRHAPHRGDRAPLRGVAQALRQGRRRRPLGLRPEHGRRRASTPSTATSSLSLVSSEQEALAEIDAAIKRIHDGTYGICEMTGKPIAKERLLAVPFTRYSAEAQKQIERNRYRSRAQAGIFGELSEEGGS